MKLKLVAALACLSMFVVSTASYAGSKWVRLGWEGNARTEAMVSFTPNGSNNNPYVAYGYTTNEGSWSSASLTFTTSMASITSKHVRLTGLTPDSSVYFRVCDDGGCGDRFWFRTAPNDNSPYVVVAGGDTRSGWTNRQNGNRLVAKVRPLFVMHGGDFTNSNNNSEWTQWLIDWELSYSNDTIDGIAYKRIYPMIGTHGNHEDGDISTICKMLGVDATRNNSCSANDTYYSVDVSPLLRVYTLNSQFQGESSSLQNAQNNWLSSDLTTNGSSATWRFAQYHKPMFPHYTGKSDNPTLFNWWAQLFYDHAMNVVVESDTHMTKLTDVVVPSGSSFTSAASGTVYVGEGSWGAPARSANDAKSWTIDLASIQQFKVITVSSTGLDVRTAQFDSAASTLSKAARDADSTVLPNNVNWWLANGVGEVLALEQDSAMRSVRAGSSGGGGNGSSVTLSASDDTFISSSNGNANYDGSADQLLADGSDSAYGEMQSLIKWDLSNISSCATVESAKIELNIFNPSSGTYAIYAGVNSWSESNATWNSVGGSGQQGSLVASFNPGSTGLYSIQLNSNGVSEVQNWVNGGSNQGVVIASAGTTDGIDFNDRENNPAPKLVVTYSEDGCGSSSTATAIEASDDTFISSSNSNTNYDGSSEQLLADGADSAYGEMHSLIRWDTSAVPTCATVEDASVELSIFNPSGGSYNIYAGVNSWSEGSATWNSVGGSSQQGSQVAGFNPGSTGVYAVPLNSAGVSTVQSWVSGGSNRGMVIASAGTTDGIDFNDRENGPAPTLNITWNDDNCGGGSTNQPPAADFDADVTNLDVDFTDFSSDSDGSVVGWSWDFGDGNTSTQENPSHSYATAGNYSVSLTVTDNDGASDNTSQSVTVTTPPTGWTVLSFDDLESGWGTWLDGGSDAKWSTSYAIGSRSLNLQDNSSSSESRLANSLNLTSYSELKIEFSYVVRSFEGSEDFWVRYSDNGGSSWQTVKAFVNNVDFVDNGTRYNPVITINSSSYNFSNNVLIKFECDASGNGDDVYIDNIRISAQ
ncbi:MAG: DNRLRE domain-containing protein [Pseudomonadales bacterium]|nr:DNRLRE domain-containing protein [Pseudomonadales bacterium]